jgi:hypothetical protein
MPHDKKGKLVSVGDRVKLELEVVSVAMGEDYCNLTAKTVIPMPPYTDPTTITLNMKQVEKVGE